MLFLAPSTTVTWLERFLIRCARPCGEGRNLLSMVPLSTVISFINKHVPATKPSSFVVELEVMKLHCSDLKKAKFNFSIIRKFRMLKNYGLRDILRRVLKKSTRNYNKHK